MTATVGNGVGTGSVSGAALTLEDDDGAPTVTLALSSSSISENGGTTTVTATLSHASSAATTVTVTGVSGFYTAGSDATIVIAAGSTANATDAATVAAVNDDVDNVGDRRVTVTGTAANGQAAAESQTVVVTGTALTLTDDEATPTVTLSLSEPDAAKPDTIDESGAGNASTVTATLARASSEAVTLTVSAAAGTNAAVGDFTQTGTMLTIAAGSTASTGTVTVTAADNAKDGPDKSVTVTATVSGTSGVADPAAVTLTIADDDGAPAVSISSPSVTEGASGATATLSFEVTLSAVSGKQVTVAYAEGTGGTATAGTDYTAPSAGTLTFAAGETSKTIDVTVTGDGTDEPDETVTVVLSGSVNATLGTATGTGTITDDDGAPSVTLALSSSSISENGGEATVTATLSHASSAATTITVAAVAGTNAVAGNFALSTNKTLSIAAGATTSTGEVAINAVDNAVTAANKEVTVSATAQNANGVTAPTNVTLTITEDDPTADAGEDQTVMEGTLARLDGSGSSDPDGDTLSYSWRQSAGSPTVTLTGATTATPTFTVPELTGGTTLTFELTVTAGGASATDAVAVRIQADNDGPTADAGEEQTVREGTAVTLAGSGTDPEDEPLSYAWRQSAGTPTVTLTSASTATPSFTAPNLTAITTLTFELTVTAGGASATDTVTITVWPRSPGGAGPMFGDAVIADQTWTQHTEIPAFTLPTATGGTGTVTYALSPVLPAGVTRDTATHAVTGTPTVAQEETTYTWTATDGSGVTADLTFTITVLPRVGPTFGDAVIADQTWTQHTEISAFTLPPATGGTGTVTYALSPALPAGVTRDAATHEVAGTPTVAQEATTYTWRATDGSGVTADLTFTITVLPRVGPTFGDAVIADQTWTQHTEISAFTLPPATGGTGTVTYALSPALPAGVTRDAATHEVAGTPTVAQEATTYTWTATDGSGATADLTFTITVLPRVGPTFGDAVIADQTWTQHTEISAFTLPPATGGTGTVTYALSPALPAGVTRDAGTHEVAGTPTVAQEATTYTWTATDGSGATADLTFTITVLPRVGPTFGDAVIDDQRWTQHTEISAFTLPPATGGTGTVTYALSPALPAGVTRDAGTHEVAGTPTVAQEATTYTWTATDGSGATADLTFTITVLPWVGPMFGDAIIDDQRWTQHMEISAFTLPPATGGTGTVTYALSPALPAGVTRDAGTHEVAGTPTVAQEATTYTWRATDGSGATADLTFTITVLPWVGPTFGDAVIANQRWTQHTEIPAFTLPPATAGTGTVTYALSPVLAAGVTRDAATHEVAGTPTVAQEETTYTWRVTDGTGATADLTFTITVLPWVGPTFGDAVIADQRWTQHTEISAFTLPPATAGTDTVTYALSPVLPAGVTRSPGLPGGGTRAAGTHAVTGTPTVDQEETAYTWTATDRTGATAEISFTIKVVPDLRFLKRRVEPQRYSVGTPVRMTLPEASGGDGELSYALAPAPPAGLTVNPATRTLSGTPTSVQALTTYTWTVRDKHEDEDSLTFTIEVIPSVRDLGLVLAGVGRTLATDAVEVLGGRFGVPAASRVQVTLGGQVLRLTEDGEGGPETDAVSEDGAGSAAMAGTGTWRRVTGLALDVARAFGVVIDGGTGQSSVDGPSYPSPLTGEASVRGNWQSPERVQTVSGKELLARSAFELPLTRSGEDGVPAWTLWGRGSASGFSGQPVDDFKMDGTLYSGYVGLDYRPKPTVLVGLGVVHSTGAVNYERTEASEKVGVDVKLTSVLPYAHWHPSPDLGVWSMLGAGWGKMAVKLAGDAGRTRTTDLTSLMGAVGGRQALTTWQGIDLAAKTDAFLTTLRSAGTTNLPGARGHAERVRLLVEGRTEWMLSAESQMQPRLELGGRWDSGTAEQGLGAEIGGGLAYTQTTWGLSVEAQGRYLMAHEDGSFEDWGASLNVRLDPGVAGQGAYLTVAPVWGQAASGVEQIWGSPSAIVEGVGGGSRSGTPGWQPQQFAVDVGYGLALSEGRGLVTPYGGLAIEGAGASRYRLGGRLELTSFLTLSLEGEQTKQAGQAATHGITFRLDWLQ